MVHVNIERLFRIFREMKCTSFQKGQNSSSDFWPSNYQVAKKQVLDFLKCLNRHILSIRMLQKNNLEFTKLLHTVVEKTKFPLLH